MRAAQFAGSVLVVTLMLLYGFDAAILLLAGLLVVYVLVGLAVPILIRARMRVTEKPPMRELRDDEIPAGVREQLDAYRQSLGALGFERIGAVHQPVGSAPPAFLALYRHPVTSARAMSRVLLNGSVPSADVELEMRYDNGTSAELSNVRTLVPGLDLIPGIARQMPRVRSVSRLHGYFTRLVERYERESGVSSASRVPLGDEATVTSVVHQQIATSAAIQERAGLLAASSVSGVRHATWRMALLLAASGVSPGAEFFRRRIASRGERLRRDLDGDARRTRYERIGTTTGWVMFGAGIALGLAGFFMSLPMACVAFAGMSIAWWIAQRDNRGGEPGWRALLAGGGAALLLFAAPMTMLYDSLSLGTIVTSSQLAALVSYGLPMVLVTVAATLLVEGFRAAATDE